MWIVCYQIPYLSPTVLPFLITTCRKYPSPILPLKVSWFMYFKHSCLIASFHIQLKPFLYNVSIDIDHQNLFLILSQFVFIIQSFLSQTKVGQQKEKSSLGLLSYPVLMAADVLLYK